MGYTSQVSMRDKTFHATYTKLPHPPHTPTGDVLAHEYYPRSDRHSFAIDRSLASPPLCQIFPRFRSLGIGCLV